MRVDDERTILTPRRMQMTRLAKPNQTAATVNDLHPTSQFSKDGLPTIYIIARNVCGRVRLKGNPPIPI